MPLPPYLRRARKAEPEHDLDRERYQTVYARTTGAVAAPTAGLHFTPELLAALEGRGIARAEVTLHVGLGTFQPVEVEDPAQHAMHAEDYVLPPRAAEAVAATRARAGRVVAVGTTSFRVLESCARPGRVVAAGAGATRLFVRPGASVQVVDVLLTNFHLPRSTLLMLVSAIAGRERVLRLYEEALAEGYRFFSYGDAMLLLP
jgi:S-adenosylmethionine:tRNA ribosyltransferase-isomerase